eukprot:scaffold158467_cov28-Tisochrysis_lutea.AAC.1
MERAPPPSSLAANPAATDDRAMLEASHSKRPREGAPPTQVRTRRAPCHPRTAAHQKLQQGRHGPHLLLASKSHPLIDQSRLNAAPPRESFTAGPLRRHGIGLVREHEAQTGPVCPPTPLVGAANR